MASDDDSLEFQIPSFRRAVSYVGRDEGFQLFSPESFLMADFNTKAAGSEVSLPPVLDDVTYNYPAAMNSMVTMPSSGAYDFDMAQVDNDCVLAAIPTLPHTRAPLMDITASPKAADVIKVQKKVITVRTPVKQKKKTVTSKTPLKPEDENVVSIGTYTRAERRKKIERYRRKRKTRIFGGKVRYKCRQNFAQHRPRVGGRFVKIKKDEEPKTKKVKSAVKARKTKKAVKSVSKKRAKTMEVTYKSSPRPLSMDDVDMSQNSGSDTPGPHTPNTPPIC
jgi:hypothetical protein